MAASNVAMRVIAAASRTSEKARELLDGPSVTAPTLALERPAFTGGVRRVLSASTGKLLWDVLSRALAFLLAVVLARSLGPEGYGRFALSWYGVVIAAQLTDLGLHLTLLRALSRAWDPALLAAAAAVKAASSALVALGISALAAAGLLGDHAAPLVLLLVATLTSSWVELFGVVLRSRGRIALEGGLLTLSRMGWLAGAAVAVGVDGASLTRVAAWLAFSAVPALALGGWWTFREVELPGAGRLAADARALIERAAPLALVSIITLVYLRADLVLVAILGGATEAGVFAGAFRLFEATFVVSGAVAAGAFPLLARRFGEKGFAATVFPVLGLLVAAGASLAIAFVAYGETMLALVLGVEYQDAAAPLRILGGALVAVFVNALTTHLLVAAGAMRWLVFAMLFRLGVGVLVDLVLIPGYGAVGAAVAVLVAESSLTLASLYALARLGYAPFAAKAH